MSTNQNMFQGKLCLAPMVRSGELPTRLLALRFGCDLVWSPEIIDKKILQCERRWNAELNTVDYIEKDRTKSKRQLNKHNIGSPAVFRTLPADESGKIIFQLGTANAALATQAAKMIIEDVAGVDVNAGCPKHFSVHCGMGSGLLRNPDNLCEILEKLVEEVGKPNNKPISVKIRILETLEETLNLVKRIVATGITNLTVHCRRIPMRNREDPIRDYLPHIYECCKANNVSLIINGALKSRLDFVRVRDSLGLPDTIGGMIAECAEQNPTIFSREDILEWNQTVLRYVELARSVDNHFSNTKYLLTRIVPGKCDFYRIVTHCKNYDELDEALRHLDINKVAFATKRKVELSNDTQNKKLKHDTLNLAT